MPLFAGQATKWDMNSVHKAGDSAQKTGDSAHLGQDSAQKEGGGAQTVAPGSDVWKELDRLAQPVASKGRVGEDVVRSTILRVCEGHFLTLEQLGRLLDRNTTALRFRFVKPLLSQGALRYRYPESPNRPDQAYTATRRQGAP
jgi:hypothetical protein